MTESKPDKHIHIVGCSPRSGTTLMQELMATCFEIDWSCKHEQNIYKRGFREPGVVCTKHPRQAVYAKGALWANPNLYVIYMVRDPRDVIVSRHASTPEHYYATLSFYMLSEKAVASLWGHSRFIIVKYEDLVEAPDEVQKKIAHKLPFLKKRYLFSEFDRYASVSEDSSRALNGVRAPDPKNMGKWRRHLPRIAAQFDKFPEATDILKRYGYEVDDKWMDNLPPADPELSESVMAHEHGGEFQDTAWRRIKALKKSLKYFRRVRLKR